MDLDALTDEEREVISQYDAMLDAGRRIRAAGFPCKHVYRCWPAAESDIALKGERVEAAIFLAHSDQPHTACFVGDTVLVSEGW
jgi:hypothetical protein